MSVCACVRFSLCVYVYTGIPCPEVGSWYLLQLFCTSFSESVPVAESKARYLLSQEVLKMTEILLFPLPKSELGLQISLSLCILEFRTHACTG